MPGQSSVTVGAGPSGSEIDMLPVITVAFVVSGLPAVSATAWARPSSETVAVAAAVPKNGAALPAVSVTSSCPLTLSPSASVNV